MTKKMTAGYMLASALEKRLIGEMDGDENTAMADFDPSLNHENDMMSEEEYLD